ncbi:MAG TPA: hypothetical protein VNV18_16660 [Stellaceae bacterium]|jgi:hypothetical protein|nr:hypothetical protein [Stellaceae bacterium]
MSDQTNTDAILSPIALTEMQETELRRIFSYYQRETERCRRANAYLAGCVMAGAELETALLLIIGAYPDDALATNKVPRHKKAIKPLLEWTLAELLRVAKAAGWLPSDLEYGKDDWDSRKAKIGDYAEVVRDIRNLAHPARYMEDHYKKRITRKHLDCVLDTLNGVSSWLYSRAEKSLLLHMQEEEERERSTPTNAQIL